jgi:hypothetical protein
VSCQEARFRAEDAVIWRGRVGLILVVGSQVVCRTDSFRSAFPSPRGSLGVVGRRRSRSRSERAGSAIASRDVASLHLLEPAER